MTATMTPSLGAQTWDVVCDEHQYAQRGLGERHAMNAMAKHNRERHVPADLDVSALADLIMEFRADYPGLHSSATMTALDTAWLVLTNGALGTPAEVAARGKVVAHVAPF